MFPRRFFKAAASAQKVVQVAHRSYAVKPSIKEASDTSSITFKPISPIERSLRQAGRTAYRFLLEQAQVPMEWNEQSINIVSKTLAKFHAANKSLGALTEEQAAEAIKKSINPNESRKVPDEVMNALFGPEWQAYLNEMRKYPIESPALQRFMISLDPAKEREYKLQKITEAFEMCEQIAKEDEEQAAASAKSD